MFKIENYHLQYGEQIIFDDVNLTITKGDRLCIVGRNGTGKSTLLKSIAGDVKPDSGEVRAEPTLRIASLAQDLPEKTNQRLYDYVAEALSETLAQIEAYKSLAESSEQADLKQLAILQQKIEVVDGWNIPQTISQVLARLELQPDDQLQDLSGGWRRRAALARALASSPDILLLDEPTNHLDVSAIQWLEEFLRSFSGALVFITHDRAFLKSVATKIAELDRGHLHLWNGDYDGFLDFRQQRLASEEKQNALFDKKLAQEEVWIRQGIKARRTRNEGRVRALKKLREERLNRRELGGNVSLKQSSNIASGKLVAELSDVSFGWSSQSVINRFSTTILRGDKIGLIGPNGIGKSTLLKLILGEIQPISGSVRQGTKLQIAYFDQTREQLDLTKNAIDNIAEGREFLEINGKERHAISYLQDFMFSGERARTPINSLSGGERNRILLAKLFSKPSNLLVMDEPTNDLDIETLELLEDLLIQYDGTLLLVSHDRYFLDNIVTSTIAFEGGGQVKEYVGGYQDWVRQGGTWPEQNEKSNIHNTSPKDNSASSEALQSNNVSPTNKKLSYKHQRELDQLPEKLERLEEEISQLHTTIASPDFYQGDAESVKSTLQSLERKESDLSSLYARWQALENNEL